MRTVLTPDNPYHRTPPRPNVADVTVPLTQDERDAISRLGIETGLTHPENIVRLALWYLAARFDLHLPGHVFQCRIERKDAPP